MSININWKLPLGNLNSIKIYHSLSPFTPLTKPSQPLAIVPITQTAYSHQTPSNGVLNYYMVEFVKPSLSMYTPCIEKLYFSNFGYGGKEVLRKTPLGHILDIIPLKDYCPIADFINLLGGSTVLSHNTTNTYIKEFIAFYKVAFEGKILFIPSSCAFTGTWANIYNAGMLTRDDKTPNLPSGTGFPTTAVKQDKRITIGNDTFKVGMPYAFKDKSVLLKLTTDYTAVSNRFEIGSEFDMIKYLFGSLGGISRDNLQYGFGLNIDYINAVQLYATNNQLVRYYLNQVSAVGSINRSLLVNSNTSGWIPILELE